MFDEIDLTNIVLYTTISLTILSIVSIILLLIIKRYIDAYEYKIQVRKNEYVKFLELVPNNNIDNIRFKSDIDAIALCEAITYQFKLKDIQKITQLKVIVEKYNLAHRIYELYKKSYTSFYKYYYISILIELRSEDYRGFFEAQALLPNISNEKAGYYLYALAILKNDYKQLIVLYNTIEKVYKNHNISQQFSELIISEAFENARYQDIKDLFCLFLINRNMTSVLVSFIYAIDERKDCNWNEVLNLFYTKYKNNNEVLISLAKIYCELNNIQYNQNIHSDILERIEVK